VNGVQLPGNFSGDDCMTSPMEVESTQSQSAASSHSRTASPEVEVVAETSHDDEDSLVGSEYPENDIRILADTLITAKGEVIADVMAGIRESLEKLNKILYAKLGK
jgi:hypothetical protein